MTPALHRLEGVRSAAARLESSLSRNSIDRCRHPGYGVARQGLPRFTLGPSCAAELSWVVEHLLPWHSGRVVPTCRSSLISLEPNVLTLVIMVRAALKVARSRSK